MKEGLASAGKSKQPKLLYRASRDGWATADFHRMCDGKVQQPQLWRTVMATSLEGIRMLHGKGMVLTSPPLYLFCIAWRIMQVLVQWRCPSRVTWQKAQYITMKHRVLRLGKVMIIILPRMRMKVLHLMALLVLIRINFNPIVLMNTSWQRQWNS